MYAQIFFYDVGDESRWSGHKTVGIEPKKDNWHYIEIVQHSNIRKSQKSYRNAERKYSNIISNCDISNYCLCFAFQNDHLNVGYYLCFHSIASTRGWSALTKFKYVTSFVDVSMYLLVYANSIFTSKFS